MRKWGTCVPVFIAALFTIAKTWKQHRSSSTDAWIKKLRYIHTMEYYRAIKRNEWVSSSEVDGPRACYTEWSRSKREKQISYTLSHFSRVQLSATLWTVALQAPLSMRFSKQEFWSGLPCPPPGDLPHPGLKARLLHLLYWQVGSLPLALPGKPRSHGL